MEVELKKYTDRELRFVLKDEDKHTLPNIIAKLALRKNGVVYAAYIIDHPLVSYPEVVILTDGSRDPLDVLIEVLEEAKRYAKSLLDAFNEALERYGKEGGANSSTG